MLGDTALKERFQQFAATWRANCWPTFARSSTTSARWTGACASASRCGTAQGRAARTDHGRARPDRRFRPGPQLPCVLGLPDVARPPGRVQRAARPRARSSTGGRAPTRACGACTTTGWRPASTRSAPWRCCRSNCGVFSTTRLTWRTAASWTSCAASKPARWQCATRAAGRFMKHRRDRGRHRAADGAAAARRRREAAHRPPAHRGRRRGAGRRGPVLAVRRSQAELRSTCARRCRRALRSRWPSCSQPARCGRAWPNWWLPGTGERVAGTRDRRRRARAGHVARPRSGAVTRDERPAARDATPSERDGRMKLARRRPRAVARLIPLLKGVLYRDRTSCPGARLLACKPGARPRGGDRPGAESTRPRATPSCARARARGRPDAKLPRLVARRPLTFHGEPAAGAAAQEAGRVRRRRRRHAARAVARPDRRDAARVPARRQQRSAARSTRWIRTSTRSPTSASCGGCAAQDDKFEVQRILKAFVDAQWLGSSTRGWRRTAAQLQGRAESRR